MDEWKKKQCRFTFPSSFHTPLPPPVRLSSVQLWLCDAKLMGAKLSSIHTLAYNALRLIPTYTNARLLSLSLSHRLSPPSRRHPHAPAHLPPLSRSLIPFLSLGCSPLFFLVLRDANSFSPPHTSNYFCCYPNTGVLTHTNSYTCSGCLTSSRQFILDQHVNRTGVGGRILKASVE